MNLTAKARAHTNIALIKYWGKKNKSLIIPFNNSISLTLDSFYTDTKVTFSNHLKNDIFTINNIKQSKKETNKITKFLNIIRNMSQIKLNAKVESTNNFATSAGLASSSSGFAALSLAASKAANLNLSKRQLSILARKGSGSACRSIYGGLVEWVKGSNDQTSFAIPIEEKINWGIQIISITFDNNVKKISSRQGMEISVNTSPFYNQWIIETNKDIKLIKQAIKEKNIDKIGLIAQNNALKMHALTISSNPWFTYWKPETLRAISIINSLHLNKKLSCYFSIDAGPNVKIICNKKQTSELLSELYKHFNQNQISISSPGPGVHLID